MGGSERPGKRDDILLARIATTLYNPFAASPEELVVSALEDAGFVGPDTTVNGRNARELLDSFYNKREKYREMTMLGSLLVKKGILDQDQLRRALTHQRENGNLKLGEALLELGICSVSEIEKSLDAQLQIRTDIESMEGFRNQINQIKKRLRKYF